MSVERINPDSVLKRTLASKEQIPAIGMGTFGSDRFSAEAVSEAVLGAARCGYRLFDCASVYGNEMLIGKVFERVMSEGVRREELFIQSKVWNDMHDPKNVEKSIKQTLKDLRLDYLDLYFVHWPFRNYHAPMCDGDSRNPLSHAYNHDEFMETWTAMEKLQKEGLTRYIGTSNMTIPKLKLLLQDCKIKPIANEMELHPCFQQAELFNFCIQNAIQPIGFCPIGSPTRPDRDKTSQDYSDIEDEVVVALAKKYGVHPAVMCLMWAVKRGQIPIPFSTKESEYLSNLRVATVDLLSDADFAELERSDKNSRLIKGQVFLWEGEDDWRVLWDEDGTIKK